MPNDQGDQRNQGVIIIEEERLKERFTQIPNTVLRRPDVTPGAKLTYVMLLSYAWQDDSCFPGQEVLARDTGVSRRSVVTYLQELQAKGLLLVKRRGLGQTNIYTLTRWNMPRSADFAHQEVQNLTHQEVQNLHANKTQETNTQQKNTQDSNDFESVTNLQKPSRSKFSKKSVANNQNSGAAQDDRGPGLRSGRSTFTPIGQVLAIRKASPLGKGTPRRPKTGPGTAPGAEDAAYVSPAESARPRPSRGRPPKATEQIEAVLEQISGEFHDAAHLQSNIGQAARLWKASGLNEAAFIGRLYEARSITKQRGDIQKRASGEAGEWGARNRMPYFFVVVRDLLGMKESQGQADG